VIVRIFTFIFLYSNGNFLQKKINILRTLTQGLGLGQCTGAQTNLFTLTEFIMKSR